ncbi:glycosyltransferase, partial [uncultured Gemmiger sp.]
MMASAAPKISILMPVYNVEPYLPQAIDSVLAQTMPDF